MRSILAAGLVALLAACGGGSDGGSNPNPGEPNDTFAQATPITPGTPLVATISAANDFDFYSFTVPAGGRNVRFQTFDAGGTQCDPANENVDPWIEVFDGAQQSVDGDDDSFFPWCEDLTTFLPAGTNYVVVGGYAPYPFVYTLRVTIL